MGRNDGTWAAHQPTGVSSDGTRNYPLPRAFSKSHAWQKFAPHGWEFLPLSRPTPTSWVGPPRNLEPLNPWTVEPLNLKPRPARISRPFNLFPMPPRFLGFQPRKAQRLAQQRRNPARAFFFAQTDERHVAAEDVDLVGN